MNRPTVLLIGQDDALAATVGGLVRGAGGLALVIVDGLDAAYAYAGWDDVALVLIRHDRSGSTGAVVRLMRMLAASRRPVATVVLGVGLDEPAEAHLLRRGAADCLLHPFDDGRLSYLIEALTLRARQAAAPGGPVGWDESDPMVAQASRVAPQDTTVLIRGEAGTGKSRLARIIHDLSPRREGPLVTLRCRALTAEAFEPEALLDDGQGGPEAPAAALAEAREGTLVLEDVESLSPAAQAALLRWIEEQGRIPIVRPGPASRPRVIATTRRDLADEVAFGRFRSDLFFRLNVIGLELAPLRLRPTEIVPLARSAATSSTGRSVLLAPEVIASLEAYEWPGNLGELARAMEAAVASAASAGREVVGLDDLPGEIRGLRAQARLATVPAGPGSTTLAQTKSEAEYLRITQALEKNGHNRLRTAHELGISRMTLYKKLYKYGIIDPPGGERPSRARSPRSARGAADGQVAGPREEPAPRPSSPGARGPLLRSAPSLH